MGACQAVGGNIVTDAFGVVAMVAMTPLITIQVLGAIYKTTFKHVAEETKEPVWYYRWKHLEIQILLNCRRREFYEQSIYDGYNYKPAITQSIPRLI